MSLPATNTRRFELWRRRWSDVAPAGRCLFALLNSCDIRFCVTRKERLSRHSGVKIAVIYSKLR
jgi:hypothetical protein